MLSLNVPASKRVEIGLEIGDGHLVHCSANGMFSVDWIGIPLPGCRPRLDRLPPGLFPKPSGPVLTSINGLDSVGSHFGWIGVSSFGPDPIHVLHEPY